MVKSRRVTWVIGIFLGICLAGCANVPSPLAPASPSAKATTDLTWIIFGIATVVFVVVEGLLLVAALKFRRKSASGLQKDSLPKQIEGNRWLEIGWTLTPVIVLAAVYLISVNVLREIAYLPNTSSQTVDDPPPIHVRVVGHQWWWEIQYPELHIVTANEIHVPLNTVIDIDLESADVIHSFWVPQLGGKIDAIPGHVNHTWFEATQAGSYHGQCAEYCGLEHADMRFEVVAETPDQFQTWVVLQQAPAILATGDAAKGEQVFMSSACTSCHTISGTNAQGKVGPDLTHFGSRQIFAGGVMENTPQNLAEWLANPQKVKPGTQMPDLGLSPDQISTLVAFLESLK
jgi:cytochrome c oxidase subunit II